jgi:hypothetical protein
MTSTYRILTFRVRYVEVLNKLDAMIDSLLFWAGRCCGVAVCCRCDDARS